VLLCGCAVGVVGGVVVCVCGVVVCCCVLLVVWLLVCGVCVADDGGVCWVLGLVVLLRIIVVRL